MYFEIPEDIYLYISLVGTFNNVLNLIQYTFNFKKTKLGKSCPQQPSFTYDVIIFLHYSTFRKQMQNSRSVQVCQDECYPMTHSGCILSSGKSYLTKTASS